MSTRWRFAMTEHTAEAQAAYPQHDLWGQGRINDLRTAFDAGRSSMVETVTTVEELDALPTTSVIVRVSGAPAIRTGQGWATGRRDHNVAKDLWLPALVVFRPDREGEADA